MLTGLCFTQILFRLLALYLLISELLMLTFFPFHLISFMDLKALAALSYVKV